MTRSEWLFSGARTLDWERGYGAGWRSRSKGDTEVVAGRSPSAYLEGWREACRDFERMRRAALAGLVRVQ